MALKTMSTSALSSDGNVDTSLVFIFFRVCFNTSVMVPVAIFSFIFFIRASKSMTWSWASCGFVTPEEPCSSVSSDDFLVALGIVVGNKGDVLLGVLSSE